MERGACLDSFFLRNVMLLEMEPIMEEIHKLLHTQFRQSQKATTAARSINHLLGHEVFSARITQTDRTENDRTDP